MNAKIGRLKNVLLIDDDPAVAGAWQTVLQRRGFQVHAVSNGKLGLRWLETQPVDLVITDIYMDVMDGIETVTDHGAPIRVYSAAKTVTDCFKFRNKIGLDVAIEALKAGLPHAICYFRVSLL